MESILSGSTFRYPLLFHREICCVQMWIWQRLCMDYFLFFFTYYIFQVGQDFSSTISFHQFLISMIFVCLLLSCSSFMNVRRKDTLGHSTHPSRSQEGCLLVPWPGKELDQAARNTKQSEDVKEKPMIQHAKGCLSPISCGMIWTIIVF